MSAGVRHSLVGVYVEGRVLTTGVYCAFLSCSQCWVTMENTALGVNAFTLEKFILNGLGLVDLLINYPICLFCFPAGLHLNNSWETHTFKILLIRRSQCLFRIMAFTPQFHDWLCSVKTLFLMAYFHEGPICTSTWHRGGGIPSGDPVGSGSSVFKA